MNFHATITDRMTGHKTTYTQDTLDEYAVRCAADGLCTKTEAKMGKTPAPSLKNWRDCKWVAADHNVAIGYNQAWNPQAAEAGVEQVNTNSFAPIRQTKREKAWLGKSVRFRGVGELREYIPEGETEARGTVWSLAPNTDHAWVLTEDKRFALAYAGHLILA